jgi:hypothetical protein
MAASAEQELSRHPAAPSDRGARPLYLWPDEAQTLLLKAALWDGEEALEAFRQWRGRFDLAGPVDGGTYRLLPLLHANMVRLGCDDPIMGVLKGVRRHAWCKVQERLQGAAQAVEFLGARGIPTIVSKGIPLALEYYDDRSLRPMSDVDIYVPFSQARPALSLLKEAGWQMVDARWEDPVVVEAHETALRREKMDLDFHWHLFHHVIEREALEADRRIWAAAVPMTVAGARTLRPSATDLLLHVALHGLKYNPMSPIRWIADVTMIVRKDGDRIDWEGALAYADRARLSLHLGMGLQFLASEIGVPIPEQVLRRVANAKPTFVESIEKSLLLHDRPLSRKQLRWRARIALGIRLASRPADALAFGRRWTRRKLARALRPIG